MSDQNWRTEVDAEDYFGHQKKRLQIADRRPVIRQASDLVGPGINSGAVRLDDYNDLLATFNGYYSSEPGAANAPNSTEAFVGYVISDANLGGRQIFTGLASGIEYSRTFERSPEDPETLGWTEWTGQRVPATAVTTGVVNTSVPNGARAVLAAPAIVTVPVVGGIPVYERSDAGIRLRRQGVYTGHVSLGAVTSGTRGQGLFYQPNINQPGLVVLNNTLLDTTLMIPFTVVAIDDQQGFSLSFVNQSTGPVTVWWRFACTRVGDAV